MAKRAHRPIAFTSDFLLPTTYTAEIVRRSLITLRRQLAAFLSTFCYRGRALSSDALTSAALAMFRRGKIWSGPLPSHEEVPDDGGTCRGF